MYQVDPSLSSHSTLFIAIQDRFNPGTFNPDRFLEPGKKNEFCSIIYKYFFSVYNDGLFVFSVYNDGLFFFFSVYNDGLFVFFSVYNDGLFVFFSLYDEQFVKKTNSKLDEVLLYVYTHTGQVKSTHKHDESGT